MCSMTIEGGRVEVADDAGARSRTVQVASGAKEF